MQISDVACVDRVAGVSLTLQLAYVWRHAEFERDPRDLHRLPLWGRVMAILPTLALRSPTNNRCQHPSPSPTQSWDMEVVEIVENRWKLGDQAL